MIGYAIRKACIQHFVERLKVVVIRIDRCLWGRGAIDVHVILASRGAPAGVTPFVSLKSTVPVAVMCNLSPAVTSMPESTQRLSPDTLTFRLLTVSVFSAADREHTATSTSVEIKATALLLRSFIHPHLQY